MATSGEKDHGRGWGENMPPLGRNRWPLTPQTGHVRSRFSPSPPAPPMTTAGPGSRLVSARNTQDERGCGVFVSRVAGRGTGWLRRRAHDGLARAATAAAIASAAPSTSTMTRSPPIRHREAANGPAVTRDSGWRRRDRAGASSRGARLPVQRRVPTRWPAGRISRCPQSRIRLLGVGAEPCRSRVAPMTCSSRERRLVGSAVVDARLLATTAIRPAANKNE